MECVQIRVTMFFLFGGEILKGRQTENAASRITRIRARFGNRWKRQSLFDRYFNLHWTKMLPHALDSVIFRRVKHPFFFFDAATLQRQKYQHFFRRSLRRNERVPLACIVPLTTSTWPSFLPPLFLLSLFRQSASPTLLSRKCPSCSPSFSFAPLSC